MAAGNDYEVFVQNLQQALLDSEEYLNYQNIKIERNKKVIDNFGNSREFDLYWEYELGGVTYKTIIECKDYASKVTVEKIDALIGKIRDIPDLKPVFATKVGYQSGAEAKAKNNKVDLLIVREQNESDWQSQDGTPLLKIIELDIQAQLPVRIVAFRPIVDGNWVKENTTIDVSKPLSLHHMNNEIYICDLSKNDRFSIFELESRLREKYRNQYGQHTQNYPCINTFIETSEYKLKLHSLSYDFHVPKPSSMPFTIDFSKELIGVIEYLQKDIKTAIFREKIVKNWGSN
ncbi:restriction endonuclease [Aeromonas salmonicida]|uniref:restriction endonuclease n=1 Tax=Aeromonas salmonicida TaxID=645 RepID=UPI003D041409